MRLVFGDFGETNSSQSWKVLTDSIAITSNDVGIYNSNVLVLEHGEVYIYESSGTRKRFLAETAYSSFRFTSICAAYGKLFLISQEGRIFGCGQTTHGECGLISPNPVSSLREISLVAPLAICPHGFPVTSAESLKVKQVRASFSEVCIIDFDGQLWKYGDGRLEFDSLGRVQVRPVPLASMRRAAQLCAGRKHFVCLAVPIIDEKVSTITDNSPILEIQQSQKCEKCREENELRLSTLMHRADQEDGSQNLLAFNEEMAEGERLAVHRKLREHADESVSEPQTPSISSSFCPIQNTEAREILTKTSPNQFEMTELKNKNFWTGFGKKSSFVSLENLPIAYFRQDTSTEGSSTTGSSGYSESSSKSAGRGSFSTFQIDPELLPEIWTWGANQSGQLGHGDFVMRREPFKIIDLSLAYCVRIAAGDEHTLALTGTGELYVWGSNSNGQLKQADATPVPKPVLFKIGSHSFVLDAFASGCHTGVIVGGVADSATLYIFGSVAESSPQVLPIPKEVGWPGWVLIENKNTLIGVHEADGRVDEQFAKVLSIFRYVKFVQRICQLCQKMHARSHMVNNSVLSKLLNKLTLSSAGYSTHLFRLTEIVRNFFSHTGSLSLAGALQSHQAKLCLNALFCFHADFVECIAFGCFAELDIGDNLDEEVNKLCLCYDTESNSQENRLRQLFQLAFNCPCRLADLAVSESGVKDTKDEPADWRCCWTLASRRLKHFGIIGDNTYLFWKLVPSHARSLKQPGRLLLWKAVNSERQQTAGVKNVSVKSNWASFRNGWLAVTVFNNAVALIEKRDVIVLNFPLVWTEVGGEGDECLVRVFGPEDEFHIRFANVECKSDFIHAMGQWWRFDFRYSVSGGERGVSLPNRRRGCYQFSAHHPEFKNCIYDGCWLLGRPHGRGHLSYPDGREYRGYFVSGRLEGFGKMSLPRETIGVSRKITPFYTVTKQEPTSASDDFSGFWRNGQLDGLAHIGFSNGDTFEGYMQNGVRHGYGLLRTMKDNDMEIYFGGWQLGLRSGYGVSTSNRERYLGMWANGSRHGKGTLISIDGVCQEGQFDNDRLVHGRLVLPPPVDGAFGVTYEGGFEKSGVVCGKGILHLSRFDRLEGQMNGDIINGEVKISSATYSRHIVTNSPLFLIPPSVYDEVPSTSQWAVEADLKWKELFKSFLVSDLGVPAYVASAADVGAVADDACRTAVWNTLASTMTKIRLGMNKDEVLVTFDADLEKIPQHTLQWSNTYYEMVQEYWSLAMKHKFHPLRRLVFGLIEVFTSSYGEIGTHRDVCSQAVSELHSINARIYSVVRLLFNGLPPTNEMFAPVPVCVDHSPTAENADPDSQSTETKTTSRRCEVDSVVLLLTPACNFIIESFFSHCYAVIFTLYSINCADLDRRYWDRVVNLNAYTDVKLLAYLEISRDLWPIDIENADDLDTPLIRATARKKFYKSAIQTLQQISSHSNPTSKLAVLADTFTEICACVSQFAAAGDSHIWSTDDLLPAFMYVTVRAQVQHLGAEIRLIEDFTPQLRGSGQIELMFTTLRASYFQICNDKNLP